MPSPREPPFPDPLADRHGATLSRQGRQVEARPRVARETVRNWLATASDGLEANACTAEDSECDGLEPCEDRPLPDARVKVPQAEYAVIHDRVVNRGETQEQVLGGGEQPAEEE